MDGYLTQNLILLFLLYTTIYSFELLVFVEMDQFWIILVEVYIFYDLLLDENFCWLLNYYLFYNWLLYFFYDFSCDVNWYLNNLLYPSLSCLQPLNYLLILWLILRNITTLETPTKHAKFRLTLLLTTIPPIWLLNNFNRIVILVDSNTNFFGRTANQRHDSGISLLLFLVDVDRHWYLNNDVFFDIDRDFFDCCLVLVL